MAPRSPVVVGEAKDVTIPLFCFDLSSEIICRDRFAAQKSRCANRILHQEAAVLPPRVRLRPDETRGEGSGRINLTEPLYNHSFLLHEPCL